MLAWAAAAGACRRSATSPPAPVAPRTDARVDEKRADTVAIDAAAEATDEDGAAAAARLNAAICKRPRCCVTRVMPAGIGSDGTRYTVVRVDLLPGRRRCAPPQTGDQQDVIDDAAITANAGGDFDEKQRERYRWDLVAERGGKVRWRQPLEIDYWNDSDFGMGGGLNQMSADPEERTVTYTREMGSAWRGDETVTVGLDPLRVVEIDRRSWWRGGEDENRVRWNWDNFAGQEYSVTAFCRAEPDRSTDAGPPDARDAGDAGSDTAIIPQVTLPAAFVKAGWATTALGACAARVDGMEHGYTIHGETRADAGDAEMRVVMSSDGVLFVEVIDDHLVPSAKSWVKADHLELWRAVGEPEHPSGCFRPDPNAKALQWGVGIDGRVYKAHGAPVGGPAVRVTSTDHGARFRIVLPDEGKGLTVVYSDSDDGARQNRLIATSNLQFGRTWTIGGVTAIGRKRATCVVDGGALRPKVAPFDRHPGLLFRNLPPEFEDDR
jgi:hypothetical protein